MLVSDLGKGVNTEKMELVGDGCLGQSIFIEKNLQKGLLVHSAWTPEFTTDTCQVLPMAIISPNYTYTSMSCKFVKTTHKKISGDPIFLKISACCSLADTSNRAWVAGGDLSHSNHHLSLLLCMERGQHLQQTDLKTVIHCPGYKKITSSVTILFLWRRSVWFPCLSPSSPLSQRPKMCVHGWSFLRRKQVPKAGKLPAPL